MLVVFKDKMVQLELHLRIQLYTCRCYVMQALYKYTNYIKYVFVYSMSLCVMVLRIFRRRFNI